MRGWVKSRHRIIAVLLSRVANPVCRQKGLQGQDPADPNKMTKYTNIVNSDAFYIPKCHDPVRYVLIMMGNSRYKPKLFVQVKVLSKAQCVVSELNKTKNVL